MKFKFFKRKTAKKPEKDEITTAFVYSNMKKASKIERNVDPVTMVEDSFRNAKKHKNT